MSRRKPKTRPESKREPEPLKPSWLQRKWNERQERMRTEQPVDRAARLTATATVWMALFTFILVLTSIGTVVILKNQLTEMHTGGEDTHTLAQATHDLALQGKENFVAEQRPYMFIDPYFTDKAGNAMLTGKPVFYGGRKVHWKIRYLNYGKTPAIGFINYGEVDFGPNALSRAYEFMAHTPIPPAKPPVPGTITPPTTTPVGYTDSFSDDKVTNDDLAYMTTHDYATVLVGRLFYSDVHGNPFYTDYCKTTYLTGAIVDCPSFNSIH